MAIVLQIGGAGSPSRHSLSAPPPTRPEEVGRVTAVWRSADRSRGPSLERGLARIVRSWFFCRLLALPSPFPSRADVKGCEVTARGRYWVEVGRRGGRQRLAKLSVRGVAAASVCAAGRCEGFIGGLGSEIRTTRRQKMRSSGRERTSFERAVFILAVEPPTETRSGFEIQKSIVGSSFRRC